MNKKKNQKPVFFIFKHLQTTLYLHLHILLYTCKPIYQFSIISWKVKSNNASFLYFSFITIQSYRNPLLRLTPFTCLLLLINKSRLRNIRGINFCLTEKLTNRCMLINLGRAMFQLEFLSIRNCIGFITSNDLSAPQGNNVRCSE